MISLLTSKVSIIDKNYSRIITNGFQKYVEDNLKGKSLQKSIKIDNEDWTKEHLDTINSKNQSTVTAFYVFYGI